MSILSGILPSSYSGVSGFTLTSTYPLTNAYNNSENTTYGRLTMSTVAYSTNIVYFEGFDFSAIPPLSGITKITVTYKGSKSSTVAARIASTSIATFSGETQKSESVTFSSSTGATVNSFEDTSSWALDELKNNFRLQISAVRGSNTSAAYIYINGMEVDVEYEFNGQIFTITSTATGNGTIVPSGAVEVEEQCSYTLKITPTQGYLFTKFEVDGVDCSGDIPDFNPKELEVKTYTYTIPSVTSNKNISVIFTEWTDPSVIFIKENGEWIEVKTVFKKVDGIWEKQTNKLLTFDPNIYYVKGGELNA